MDHFTQVMNAMKLERLDKLKNSDQLMLGELILKFELVKNKELPVYYDNKEYFPTTIDSWRGSYEELALDYVSINKHQRLLTSNDLLQLLKKTVGSTLQGYKGGDFVMGRTTPVWVANYGESSGFTTDHTAVIDVEQLKDIVIIKTKNIEFF